MYFEIKARLDQLKKSSPTSKTPDLKETSEKQQQQLSDEKPENPCAGGSLNWGNRGRIGPDGYEGHGCFLGSGYSLSMDSYARGGFVGSGDGCTGCGDGYTGSADDCTSSAGPEDPYDEFPFELHRLIEGRICRHEWSSCFEIEYRYPLDEYYGGACLGKALEIPREHLSMLSGSDWTQPANPGLLFLDTETTGLSGGAGTVAFLVGLGYFEDDCFVVKQLFMRDFHEEPALLEELDKYLSENGILVTFNGKAFDWNLLFSRYTFNRMRPSCEMVHLDLLYPARRLWKLKLESCRLSALEEQILSVVRDEDIPGSLIPEVYFRYLQSRDARVILKVLEHNRYDILSMVALLCRMDSILSDPLTETDGEWELFGAGNLFAQNGRLKTGMDCFQGCLNAESDEVKNKAAWKLLLSYKKSGEWSKAVQLLERTLETPGPNLKVRIELAKCYEHWVKDPGKALEVTENAISVCRQLGIRDNIIFNDLIKRRERLLRKLMESQNTQKGKKSNILN